MRNPYKNVQITENKDIELSPQQMEAYTTYSNMLDGEGGTGLLFGVTGSGKTQVYLKLIDKALENQKMLLF